MNKKVLVPTVLCLALAITAVIIVLATKAASPEPKIAPEGSSGADSSQAVSSGASSVAPSQYADATLPPEAATKLPAKEEQSTLLGVLTTAADAVTSAVESVQGTIGQYFTLPQAPAYSSGVKIPIGNKKVMSYRYNADKNYYYTDDKECWQSNFGFNKTYDVLAPLGVMYYQTVRTAFDYGDKSWRLQIWKGQYGTMFVGGEIGIYTQDINASGDHYVCAAKDDWLNMEMTVYWDAYVTGNYFPVLTRPYEKYWWCTGFVAGFEEEMMKDHTDLRIMARITFKDVAMANAFCEQFENNGFKRVSRISVGTLDSFMQVGPDVAFVWQNLGTNN